LTSESILPNRATAAETAAAAWPALVTSSSRASRAFPASGIACVIAPGCRAVAATWSPRPSARRVISRPKPREAPVMNQTLMECPFLPGPYAAAFRPGC
jgi:hypothetical protein